MKYAGLAIVALFMLMASVPEASAVVYCVEGQQVAGCVWRPGGVRVGHGHGYRAAYRAGRRHGYVHGRRH
jgi:hypothetical protein